jgi:hypothetical protein
MALEYKHLLFKMLSKANGGVKKCSVFHEVHQNKENDLDIVLEYVDTFHILLCILLVQTLNK